MCGIVGYVGKNQAPSTEDTTLPAWLSMTAKILIYLRQREDFLTL